MKANGYERYSWGQENPKTGMGTVGWRKTGESSLTDEQALTMYLDLNVLATVCNTLPDGIYVEVTIGKPHRDGNCKLQNERKGVWATAFVYDYNKMLTEHYGGYADSKPTIISFRDSENPGEAMLLAMAEAIQKSKIS